MNTENIITRLSEHHIKPSVHRMAVLRYLMSHRTHPTADMIYTALQPEMPTLSKTTVYNILKLLAEKGAVQILTIDEKNVRFDGDITPHAHFQCRTCEKVYDLPAEINKTVACFHTEGLTIDEMQLYCKGYCKNCMQRPK